MASFSYQQHHPFLLDPVFLLPNTPIKMSGFSEEPNTTTTTTTCFSQFYPLDQFLHPIPVDVSSNNEPSVTNIKHSTDSSSVVDNPESTGEQVSQKVMTTTTMDKKRKSRDGSSMTSAQSKHAREVKGKKQNKCKSVMKDDDDDEEKKPKADHKKDMKKKKKEVPEEAPTGYIHVRARRGQATDSHSLAERVRREKISERMKLLQALVPGCDKVSGKALMLDEIINYVQSLQNQVEFLSMKLASVNPMFYDFGMDLDAFMVTPDQRLDGLILSSPLPNVQQGKPPQASTAFSDATTSFTTPNSSYPLLFQQGQRPNTLPHQDNGQLLWDVDDHRQKLVNQSGFSNNLCSFH